MKSTAPDAARPKRRALLRLSLLAAAGGAASALVRGDGAEAADGSYFRIGAAHPNRGSSTTTLTSDVIKNDGVPALLVKNQGASNAGHRIGIQGHVGPDASNLSFTIDAGVHGRCESSATNTAGVYGTASGPGSRGVYGSSRGKGGIGVHAFGSIDQMAIKAENRYGPALYVESGRSAPIAARFVGTTVGTAILVEGITSGTGVQAITSTGRGIWGHTTGSGDGVRGIAAADGTGVSAQAGPEGTALSVTGRSRFVVGPHLFSGAVTVTATSPVGAQARAGALGILGGEESGRGVGVWGTAGLANDPASMAAGLNAGVVGTSSHVGVAGFGGAPDVAKLNARVAPVGVMGIGTHAGGSGVYGRDTGSPGHGVEGESENGAGVQGTGLNIGSIGVRAASTGGRALVVEGLAAFTQVGGGRIPVGRRVVTVKGRRVTAASRVLATLNESAGPGVTVSFARLTQAGDVVVTLNKPARRAAPFTFFIVDQA
jgi:hypothetical protein